MAVGGCGGDDGGMEMKVSLSDCFRVSVKTEKFSECRFKFKFDLESSNENGIGPGLKVYENKGYGGLVWVEQFSKLSSVTGGSKTMQGKIEIELWQFNERPVFTLTMSEERIETIETTTLCSINDEVDGVEVEAVMVMMVVLWGCRWGYEGGGVSEVVVTVGWWWWRVTKSEYGDRNRTHPHGENDEVIEMVVEVVVAVWQVVKMMMYGVDDRFGGDVDDGEGWRGSAGVAENIIGNYGGAGNL
ncbi:hypothetical protein Tco_0821050 [Tanacetum coccineum]|uniref:Uncharacterized protein n=1 Tax=Tanacetum coccineum TaxID=301880 RepID=A0ABQ5AFE4_9ASTR